MKTTSFIVNKHEIGQGKPVFIIAEIGNNHNGSLATAKELVDKAIQCGVDAVKFQLRDMEALYGKDYLTQFSQADLATQYTLDLLSRFQLSLKDMAHLFAYCREKQILAFCTPWDIPSVHALQKMDIPLYKVASADLTNHQLLQAIAATGKPVLCSCGMATEQEIEDAIAYLDTLSVPYALLHCNSTYPAPFKDVHLNYLARLKARVPVVGYSGHERGIAIPIAAVALGAHIIEKHFTLDKTWEGNDHKVSLLPQEMKDMVTAIRNVEEALGSGNVRTISQGELINRENLAKSVVAIEAIAQGQVFTAELFQFLSPGQGLPPYQVSRLLGHPAKRAIPRGGVLYESDLPHVTLKQPRPYHFRRPWGLPVRYHDAHQLMAFAKPDLVEFHLSYKDMDEDPGRFLSGTYPQGFVVHAPELFQGDHLLDLCAPDPAYKAQSVENMKRVIAITKQLAAYFPNQKRPLIVTNVGGFSKNAPLTAQRRQELYQDLLGSLEQLLDPAIEIIPQTMAPFPWHMGGQQYQNLFKLPEECDWFCQTYGYRMCLDYSHSHLTCNHHGYTMQQFVDWVGPHTAHIHLGDGRGVDGEGLQIGDGDIDFAQLARLLDQHCPRASFIPEIWQGHKNGGEGFWTALERLEQWF